MEEIKQEIYKSHKNIFGNEPSREYVINRTKQIQELSTELNKKGISNSMQKIKQALIQHYEQLRQDKIKYQENNNPTKEDFDKYIKLLEEKESSHLLDITKVEKLPVADTKTFLRLSIALAIFIIIIICLIYFIIKLSSKQNFYVKWPNDNPIIKKNNKVC